MIGKDGKPKNDMQRIHKIILATLILHNMTAEHEYYNPEWISDHDSSSDDDDGHVSDLRVNDTSDMRN